ncbi:MAG: hypothetical protein U1E65_23930 [Myxococcota bacterium]
MRRKWLIPLLTCLVGTGCGALDKFDVTLTDSASIPGSFMGMVFQPQYAGSYGQLNLSGDQTFKNNNVKPSDVDSIFVKSIELEDSQPMLNNLSNVVDSVSFYVSAPGMEKKLIGSGMAFQPGATATLTVDSTLPIKPYAVSPSMSISADIKLKKSPALNFSIKSTITLHVDINLLGT